MFRPYTGGHLQVEIKLTDQLYKMCGAFCLGIGWGGTRSRFNSGYHDLGLSQVDFFFSCLCTHVKWVTVLMLRVCYNCTISKIYFEILKNYT